VVALLGSNGAGKTTLLKTVSGLIRPSEGRIELDGRDVTRVPAHRRASGGLCHIPEGRGVFRALTVTENLVMQVPPGQSAEAIARAVEAFPTLGRRLGQRAGTLSGGEQQMLALARAYAGNPSTILVDEASLGLAPVVVDAVFEFLHRVAAGGAALLIVDQFVARALAMATLVYVLRRGEIVYEGPPAAIPADDVFAQYLGTG
jgi:branched-chain amino acid transport system ATP-binding protein